MVKSAKWGEEILGMDTRPAELLLNDVIAPPSLKLKAAVHKVLQQIFCASVYCSLPGYSYVGPAPFGLAYFALFFHGT